MKTAKRQNKSETVSGESQDAITAEFCVCKKCHLSKSETEFYTKENGRRDKTCIECRKSRRVELYELKKSNAQETNSEIEAAESARPAAGLSEVTLSEANASEVLIPYETVLEIAQAFLVLEGWQCDLDAQGDLSNPNVLSRKNGS